jgi:hypothetical protein
MKKRLNERKKETNKHMYIKGIKEIKIGKMKERNKYIVT